MRIWVIDENPEDQTRIAQLLKDNVADLDLIAVADHGTYQQVLAGDSPDGVLTSDRVSWTNSLDLLASLQARLPGVPLIMVSGTCDERLAVRCMKAGLSDYVPKAHLEMLPDAVTAALGMGAPPGGNGVAGGASLEHSGELDAVLSSIADAVIVYGPEGEIRRMNAAAELLAELDGWEGTRALSDPLASWRVLDSMGDVRAPETLPMMRALQGETVRSELLSIRRGAGEGTAWLAVSAAPILTGAGKPHGAVATITDVTAHFNTQHQLEDANAMLEEQAAELEEQAEEMRLQNDELHALSGSLAAERARLQATLAALPAAVFITDAGGRLIELNDHARALWELRADDETCAQLYADRAGWWTGTGERVRPEEWPMMRALQSGEVCTEEMVDIQRFDGTRGTILNSAAPILDGEGQVVGGVSVSSDVTPLLRTQQQVEEANVVLEEQAAELEEQASELEEQAEEMRIQNDELHSLSGSLVTEQARLQAILSALPVAVLIADAQGFLIEMNDHARALWGLRTLYATFPERYGNHLGWWTDTGEQVRPDEWPMMRALRHGELSTAQMIDIESAGGGRSTILKSAAPILDSAGEITGAVAICQDITQHRRLENALAAERELLQLLYDTVPVMFSIYDPEIERVVLSKHFERVTGWSEDDTTQTNVMELVYPDPEYRAEVAAYMQSLQPGFKDIQMVAKHGEVIESSWANIQLPDGRQVGIGLDITDRKRAEAALTEYAEELEQLNQTNQMLLREVNHRVKNNLTAILGLIYAEKRRLNSGARSGVDVAGIMDDLAQRVGSLSTVHSLLSVSGWRPLRLDMLAGQVIEAAAPAAQGVRRLIVDVRPSPVEVTAEQAHHVALVLGELVTNSVKYGCCGEELRITLQSKQDEGHVHVTYRDGGGGYPDAVLAGETRSVGMSLLNTIVDISLRGAWSIRNDQGAVTELRFPCAGS
jgi:PAS domain S-box-containing protein